MMLHEKQPLPLVCRHIAYVLMGHLLEAPEQWTLRTELVVPKKRRFQVPFEIRLSAEPNGTRWIDKDRKLAEKIAD
jgi:hypothetical protein